MEINDKTYFGLANQPDFKDDKRQEQWANQRETQGFDSTELWNLDHTLSRFILPRLKAFRVAYGGGHPGDLDSPEQWEEILDKMIAAFEIHTDEDRFFCINEIDRAILTEGFDLFAKYYFHLWN